MADYHPLIARAVAGLERNTGENRRALYERARTALVAQLRGITPALNESDITRERLALEDAIRKVESEASRRARGDLADEGTPRPDAAEPPPPPRPDLRSSGPSLSDQGLKGFRQVVAEAEGLGGAAAEASKAARDTLNTMSDEERMSAFVRREPTFGESPPPAAPPPSQKTFGENALGGLPPAQDADTPAFSEPEVPVDDPEPPEAAEADSVAEQLETARSESDTYRDSLPASPPEFQSATAPYEEEQTFEGPRRSYRGAIKWAVIVLLLVGAGAAGYWQRSHISSMVASLRSSSPSPTATPAAQTSAERPKIADRVGSNDGPRSANAPTADVAQKVVLYDEDPNDPQGKRYVGSAVWRTETVSPGPGLAPELAIRADVEIPERRLRMSWSLRRNTDKTLPASHTIEILFTLPADFPEGGISNIPGILMKQSEQTRGTPLAGLAVKVTNGFFLIGLSAVDVDLARNIDLLKTRSWFDLPIVYNSNKRAILAVERGPPGDRIFEEAFRAWGQ